MKRSSLLLLMLITNIIYAQKINRACSAFSEMKYDKAIDLFTDVLEKTPNSVPALVGYSKTNQEIMKLKNVVLEQSEIEKIINFLKTAEQLYPSCSTDDFQNLSKNLQVFSIFDINTTKITFSNLLWNEYYANKNNIDSIEFFSYNFAFGDKTLALCKNRISYLSYNLALSENSINAFKTFLKKFPNSNEADLANKAIEDLEISAALGHPRIDSLEWTIQKYPRNPKVNLLEQRLGELYIKTIDENSSRIEVERVKKNIKTLSHIDTKEMIAVCDGLLLKLTYNELLNSSDLYKIANFINANARNSSLDLTQLKNRKNILIKEKLESSNEINYELLVSLVNEVPFDYQGISQILSKVSDDLRKRCYDGLKEFIANYINQHIEVVNSSVNALVDLVVSNLNTSPKLTNESIYQNCKAINFTNQDEIIQELVNRLEIFKSFLSEDFYIKKIDDSWEIINTLSVNKTGGKLKRKYYKLNSDNDSYALLPDIKTTAPIYTAIRQRYNVFNFSIPKILRKTDMGFDVLIYGYTNTDAVCCPSYEMSIKYKYDNKSFTPDVANYINRSSYNISGDELSEYYRFGLNLLED